MAEETNPKGEEESLEILRDRTRTWWLSVLAGQAESSHPIHGARIKATVRDGVLTLSGTLTSEEDRRDILSEADHFKQSGVSEVIDELKVEAENAGSTGLLVQTLIGVFENRDQAGFAEGYLEGHAHITPDVMKVIAQDGEDAGATLHAIVPAAWISDAEQALGAGRALLIVTVDETQAFKARELLDEETNSLRTLVLPPEATRNAAEQQHHLDKIPSSPQSRQTDQKAERAREDAVQQEAGVHES